ncbi:MAG: tonB [Alphaproteobacteria bacterium]|nr:tonB [Alphaproteobacteria bacterium]
MAQKPIFNPPPPEAMTSRLAKVTRRRGRVLTLLVSLAALASFGGVIYWAHEKDRESGGQGLVPLIRADEKPIKIKPDTPGGLVVPNQDKTVYERVAPGSVPQGPEKLLPPPPTPQIPPSTPPQPPQPAAAPSPAGQAPVAAAPTPPVTPGAPAASEPPKPQGTETLTPPAPGAPPVAAPSTQPQGGQSIATLIDTLSGHRIQIASVRTEEQAKATWARLQQSHGDVLGSLTMRAVRADLGERGTFYRVQAGPLDGAGANAACTKLRTRSVDCIVVNP